MRSQNNNAQYTKNLLEQTCLQRSKRLSIVNVVDRIQKLKRPRRSVRNITESIVAPPPPPPLPPPTPSLPPPCPLAALRPLAWVLIMLLLCEIIQLTHHLARKRNKMLSETCTYKVSNTCAFKALPLWIMNVLWVPFVLMLRLLSSVLLQKKKEQEEEEEEQQQQRRKQQQQQQQ